MRVLILGGDGMMGHTAFRVLSQRFETIATFHSDRAPQQRYSMFRDVPESQTLVGVDVLQPGVLPQLLNYVRPDAVLNCVGLIKQREDAKHPLPAIRMNSLFPHELAQQCREAGAFLIHLSTDCVFSGRRGRYSIEDIPDPVDLYGRSKLLGELTEPGTFTMRSSIIGWELKGHAGLLGWFAQQRGKRIRGFRNAIYTGLSTTAMAGLLAQVIERCRDERRLEGLVQVASQPIDKYTLLVRLRDALGWTDIEIVPDETFVCDRSLVSSPLPAGFELAAPGWDEMIRQLAAEWKLYESAR